MLNLLLCYPTLSYNSFLGGNQEEITAHKGENVRGFALLSCSSTPYKRLTDPKGIPAMEKSFKKLLGMPLNKITVLLPLESRCFLLNHG